MIDLPVGAEQIEINGEELCYYIPWDTPGSEFAGDFWIPFPPGEYEIVGTGTLLSDLAEKIAAMNLINPVFIKIIKP